MAVPAPRLGRLHLLVLLEHLLEVLQVAEDVHGDDVLQRDLVHGGVGHAVLVALVQRGHLVIEQAHVVPVLVLPPV